MIVSGWINITISILLSCTLGVIVYHYYGAPKTESAEKAEQPKYRMLDDEDD